MHNQLTFIKLQTTPKMKNKKTNLEKVFSLFCAHKKSPLVLGRPVTLQPFVVGDKTYATDSYALVRCDNSKIDFKFENPHEPLTSVESAVPEPNMSEIINIDNIDWDTIIAEDKKEKRISTVVLKDKTFSVHLFHKLKKTKDLMKCDIELCCSHKKYSPAMFKVGFTEILIMPLNDYYGDNVVATIK